MRNYSAIALFALMVTGYSSGQQTSPSMPVQSADAQPATVKVYAVGPDVTAPKLLPQDLPPISTEKCRNKADGKVVLSLLVDTTGKPRNVMFLRPLGNDLDGFALQIVGADQFSPGTSNGAPVVVGESVEVNMHTCAEQTEEDVTNKSYRLRLRSQPEQKFGVLSQTPEQAILTSVDTARSEFEVSTAPHYKYGSGVTAPLPIQPVPEAVYTVEALKAKFSGICLISLTVDAYGMPENVQVKKHLDYGLTENAIATVKRYRFKPAMKNGEPVPVKIDIEVNFRTWMRN